MLLFTVLPNFDVLDMEKIEALMDRIRTITKEIQEDFTEVSVGYSGDVAIQADEITAMNYDMFVPAGAARSPHSDSVSAVLF